LRLHGVKTAGHRRLWAHRYDPVAYIAAGEVHERVQNDPVPLFREWLLTEGHATEDELKAVDVRAVQDVDEAWEFADSSAYPDVDELYTDVFAPTAAS
jgi:TPP-dependent pyruvate/acetoin dehydrogenase alpha subunit